MLAFDLEKNGYEMGVAETKEMDVLSKDRRSDKKGTHFEHAVRGGRGGLLKLLLMSGINPNSAMFDENGKETTAMSYSSRSNFPNSIVTLLAHGADINTADQLGYTPLALAVIHESLGALDVLLRCRRYRRAPGLALVFSCRYGKENIVLQLLERCGGAHPGPINPLEPVAFDPDAKLSLEDQQLRPDLPPVPLDVIDDDEKLPLGVATRGEATAVTSSDDGVSTTLSEEEATLKRPGLDYTGNGPLHWASHGGHARIVNLLLASGADPFFENKKGKLSMDLAREAGHHNICIRLQRATAGGEKAAAEYRRRRLGETEHRTTMRERVTGVEISSSEEEEEEEEMQEEMQEGIKVFKKRTDNEKKMDEEKEKENLQKQTEEKMALEEDERNMQFLLHPLCGECNQTSWATREKLLNPETLGTMDRGKKMCPGFDPSRHNSLVCRYCGHSRGRHHSDPLVVAKMKEERRRKYEESLVAAKDERKAVLAAMVAAAI